mmetsp:Transcript_857/g.1857  ORF Transcript_857/g.1857 Transcript_857/m.1857 type:complete len:212 (+) Transcript_857:57-692(+)
MSPFLGLRISLRRAGVTKSCDCSVRAVGVAGGAIADVPSSTINPGKSRLFGVFPVGKRIRGLARPSSSTEGDLPMVRRPIGWFADTLLPIPRGCVVSKGGKPGSVIGCDGLRMGCVSEWICSAKTSPTFEASSSIDSSRLIPIVPQVSSISPSRFLLGLRLRRKISLNESIRFCAPTKECACSMTAPLWSPPSTFATSSKTSTVSVTLHRR